MSPGSRKYILPGIALLAVLVYVVRLFFIQVVDDRLKIDARNQAFLYMTDYPPRGAIYDRNGKLLVFNQVAYDLMVVPRDIRDCDTAGLCSILNISKEEFRSRLAHLSGNIGDASHDYRTHVFESQMLPELNARIQERLYKFSGFFVQARTVRQYPVPIAAHLLGYIGEVNERIMKKDQYYRSGDYTGISGIEKGYEEFLRGKKGVQIKMRDVHNNIKGSYRDGLYDTAAVPGSSLVSTLDADLQLYAESLMQNKVGGLAAMDPNTGEILALVTSPTYDPNLLVGRDFPKNFTALNNDTFGVPLFNRALQAMYPPGSAFKLMNALIAQQEGVISSTDAFPCEHGYPPLGRMPGCHSHASPVAMRGAISSSCNSYFAYAFKAILDNPKYKKQPAVGYEAWRKYVNSFGIGTKIGTDLPFELKGNVPPASYYDKIYGKSGWQAHTVISLAIGQGELLITPLQMCNIMCSIANRGFYFTPHIIRSIGNGPPLEKWQEKHFTLVTNKTYYENVIDGMIGTMEEGTAHGSAIPGIEVCGKTGTAQNPHGENHSVFVCFAPREKPEICVAVVVENAGQGAWWSAPIASLVIEKYLTHKILRKDVEKRMLEGNLLYRHPEMKKKAA
jgi:penicillin-binding protein 2